MPRLLTTTEMYATLSSGCWLRPYDYLYSVANDSSSVITMFANLTKCINLSLIAHCCHDVWLILHSCDVRLESTVV